MPYRVARHGRCRIPRRCMRRRAGSGTAADVHRRAAEPARRGARRRAHGRERHDPAAAAPRASAATPAAAASASARGERGTRGISRAVARTRARQASWRSDPRARNRRCARTRRCARASGATASLALFARGTGLSTGPRHCLTPRIHTPSVRAFEAPIRKRPTPILASRRSNPVRPTARTMRTRSMVLVQVHARTTRARVSSRGRSLTQPTPPAPAGFHRTETATHGLDSSS